MFITKKPKEFLNFESPELNLWNNHFINSANKFQLQIKYLIERNIETPVTQKKIIAEIIFYYFNQLKKAIPKTPHFFEDNLIFLRTLEDVYEKSLKKAQKKIAEYSVEENHSEKFKEKWNIP